VSLHGPHRRLKPVRWLLRGCVALAVIRFMSSTKDPPAKDVEGGGAVPRAPSDSEREKLPRPHRWLMALLWLLGACGAVAVVGFMSYTRDPAANVIQVGLAVPGVAADPADPLFRADVSVQVDTKLQPFRPGRFKRRLTCTQPAEVTAVFSGTSKLWTMQRDSPHRQRFAVGITAPVQDLSAADAVSSEAPLDPTVTARPRTTTGLAGKGNLRVWQPHKLDASDGRSGADVEVVGGWVRHWARHQTPLVVHFRAPWVSYRSFGSCYVRLPRLLLTEVAEDASLDIQPSSGDAPLGIVTFAGVNAGLTRLNSDGTVVGDISQPRPSAFGGVESFRGTEDAIWRCQAKSHSARIRYRE
jgi:hypothetical protein